MQATGQAEGRFWESGHLRLIWAESSGVMTRRIMRCATCHWILGNDDLPRIMRWRREAFEKSAKSSEERCVEECTATCLE